MNGNKIEQECTIQCIDGIDGKVNGKDGQNNERDGDCVSRMARTNHRAGYSPREAQK